MRIIQIGLLAVWLSITTACSTESPAVMPVVETASSIIRLDPAFDLLVPSGAVIEKVADGFEFIEGPVWMSGRLMFSDIPANTVYSWSPDRGTEVFLQPVLAADANTGGAGGSNGLARDPTGNLILCEHGNRRVARMNSDGSRTTLADRYDGGRLNSPNDIVYHSSGAAFFTDPPYGLPELEASSAREQAHNGIYRLDVDGTVTLLAEQTRPNGIGLSPDERVLYVANSAVAPNRLWMAYAVLDDLTLGDGSVFYDASAMQAAGVPDGLSLDRAGNLYATGPGGVMVFNSAGKHLGTIAPAEQPANAGWGDDGKTLYMTARTGLYRIRLSATGLVYRD